MSISSRVVWTASMAMGNLRSSSCRHHAIEIFSGEGIKKPSVFWKNKCSKCSMHGRECVSTGYTCCLVFRAYNSSICRRRAAETESSLSPHPVVAINQSTECLMELKKGAETRPLVKQTFQPMKFCWFLMSYKIVLLKIQ